MFTTKKCVATVAVALAALTAAATTAQAQTVGGLTVLSSSINPSNPRVGEYYTLSITVRNDYLRTVNATATLTSWPNGDVPQGARSATVRLTPGATSTFQFTFYCGVEGGTVFYRLSAAGAN